MNEWRPPLWRDSTGESVPSGSRENEMGCEGWCREVEGEPKEEDREGGGTSG